MRWRRELLAAVAGLLCVLVSTPTTQARLDPRVQGPGRQENAGPTGLRVLPVQGNVSMIAGAGGNIAVQVGEDGVLLVDTGRAESSRGVIDTIKGLTDKPIRQIINTHVHEHHTGGNEAFTRLGVPIIAHENTLNRMSAPTGEPPPRPSSAWPTDTFFTTKKELFFNGEAIEILHQPAAHTDGDVFVYFRRSDVVVTGDIFVTTHFPVIDVERGGSIDGLIAALNRLMDITIPRRNQEGGTYVIPGVGRLCDEADVVEFRDMVTIVRDRVRHMIEKGMTLAQAKAAAPALDYEGRWGSTGGQWTADGFVEAVFNDLSKKDRR